MQSTSFWRVGLVLLYVLSGVGLWGVGVIMGAGYQRVMDHAMIEGCDRAFAIADSTVADALDLAEDARTLNDLVSEIAYDHGETTRTLVDLLNAQELQQSPNIGHILVERDEEGVIVNATVACYPLH